MQALCLKIFLISASGKDDWTISRIYPARITYNGQVLMWPPVTFKVSCHFDFSDYPNDQQVCPLVFGSLKYSKELADYNWAPVAPLLSLSYRSFKRHISGWKVLSVSNKRYFWHENQRSNTTSDATTNFIEMMAFIKLQRFQPYFQILLVLPALACSVFTIFALNKQSGEIGLFILLMVLMIQGIFARSLIIKLPIGGATPRIGMIAIGSANIFGSKN